MGDSSAPARRQVRVPHEVLDGIDRVREVRLAARGGVVTLYTPPGSEAIKLNPDQGRTLAAAIQGAANRAGGQTQ